MTVHKAKGLQWNNVIFIYDFSLLDLCTFYNLEEEKCSIYHQQDQKKIYVYGI